MNIGKQKAQEQVYVCIDDSTTLSERDVAQVRLAVGRSEAAKYRISGWTVRRITNFGPSYFVEALKEMGHLV